jgi:LAO/AO transport system kinase
MLKAGILEIADLFIVNKADLEGADRTVQELKEMIEYRDGTVPETVGHHGAGASGGFERADADGGQATETWTPPIVEAVAKNSEGVDGVLTALADHRDHLVESGELEKKEQMRYAEEIRTLLREDMSVLLEREIDRLGGLDEYVQRVRERETDPYAVSDEILDPIVDCLDERAE